MTGKILSILILMSAVFLFMGCASADSDYYTSPEPNEITIGFVEDGSYYVATPDNNYYQSMLNEIYACIHDQTLDKNANASTLKDEVGKICRDWGIDNPDIAIKSPYGDDSFILMVMVNGSSMEPTVHDGEMLVLNKTHDFKVGDIVSAYYPPKNLNILKRVEIINGDKVYLVSDNVNGTIVESGQKYEGLRAWVNMSDINGVLIDVYSNGNYN